LFDVAIAGPIAGGTVAGTLFFYGLALSLNGDPNTLLPVPNELFNGSLLLGSVAQLFLGDAAQTAKGAALVHPLFVAGWYVFFLFFFVTRRRDDFSRARRLFASVSFPKGFSSSTF
jgi:membrane-associated protease RseP (regulator of RpoE activity)